MQVGASPKWERFLLAGLPFFIRNPMRKFYRYFNQKWILAILMWRCMSRARNCFAHETFLICRFKQIIQAEKNQRLIKERGISFEQAITAIENGAIVDVLPHPNASKYPNQYIYVLNINEYVYVVPFVEENQHSIFLKTIFPHRKLTQQYLTKGDTYEKT